MNVDVEVLSQRTTDNRQQSSVFHVQIERITRKSLHCTINGQGYEVLLSQNGCKINKVIINGMTESIFVSETSDNNYCVHLKGLDFICRRTDELNDSRDYSYKEDKNNDLEYRSPMPGKVIKVNVKEGDDVKEGDVLCVVEAMKMENDIQAENDGTVEEIFIGPGDAIAIDDCLMVIK